MKIQMVGSISLGHSHEIHIRPVAETPDISIWPLQMVQKLISYDKTKLHSLWRLRGKICLHKNHIFFPCKP